MKNLQFTLEKGAKAPERQRSGDAGYDLRSLNETSLAPGERKIVNTGIRVAIPEGYAGLIIPRSGLSAKHGITVVNSPGLIDSGYRGTLQIILLNTGQETWQGQQGERIAQLVLIAVATPELEEVEELAESHDGRGAKGFGSSGTK